MFIMDTHCHTTRALEKDHVSCLSITKEHTRPRMELRHLRYFVAVAEAENVSRAALKLRVSQPAVSRQIRDLEDELGFPLLERTARSVRLTEAGRVFLLEARAMLQRVEEAVEGARAVATGRRGELHVGYAMSPTVRILPPALRAFQAASPGVRVRLHDLSTTEILAGLREGKLKIALLVCPNPTRLRGLRFEELARGAMIIAVAPKHPFARRRSVTLAEVALEPLIAFSRQEYPDYQESLASLFATIGITPRIEEEHDSVASLIAAIEAGSGVAVVTESLACVAGPRLKLTRLSPAPQPFVVGAAWPKAGLTAAAEQFLKCAREAALMKV
jgi:DNA-binding transcriptional LysR family regulator